jgi:type IV pilus assembly protein PilX
MKIHPRFRPSHCRRVSAPRAQRGVSLFFALIAVLVMLIAAVAIVRSFNTSLFQAGNLAFKRDLTNQSERAVASVFEAMTTGSLGLETARDAHQLGSNYSASILDANPQGIPLALLNPGDPSATTNRNTFFGVGRATNDIALTDANGTVFGSVRYVVERLCNATGTVAAVGPSGCIFADGIRNLSSSSSELIRAEDSARVRTGTDAAGNPIYSTLAGASSQRVVYRISVRVTGPRGTEGIYQSTFTR